MQKLNFQNNLRISKIKLKPITSSIYIQIVFYLQIYNDALILSNDCQAKDALNYIEKKLVNLRVSESAEADETERWLYQIFCGIFSILRL